MLSHGGHTREQNLWVSKLRNYKCKHFQQVDRTAKYTLYPTENSSQQIEPEKGDGIQSLKGQTTDLQHCVQLLSHLLEMDGSLMGGSTTRKQTVKSKKKRVHVVPQPKVFGKGVTSRGSLVKGGFSKSGHNTKKAKSRMKGPARTFGLPKVVNVNDALTKGSEAAGDHQVPEPSKQQDAASDVSEPVPYNTRIASSTPNNTILKELTNANTPPQQIIKAHQDSAPERGRNMTDALPGRIMRECMQPDLPLAFVNLGYNLTPGQSNPLNSSSQINIVQPPEAEHVPKLIQGRVEFKPNPLPWFQAAMPDSLPPSHDINEGDVTHSKMATASTGCQGEEFDRVTYHEAEVAYPLDPPEKEVNFSLYTSVNDASTVGGAGQPEEPLPNSDLKPSQMATPNEIPVDSSNDKPLVTETSNGTDKTLSAAGSCTTNVIKIPTGLKRSEEISTNSLIQPSSSSSVKSQKDKEKKTKTLTTKGQSVVCTRCSGTDRRKQILKSKVNPPKTKIKPKSKIDKAVQFTISNASTQCSPEWTFNLPALISTCTEPCMSQQSMKHMLTLQCLLEEMKSQAEVEQNPKLQLLLKQIHQTAAMFVPGLGGIDWRTELELAIQPLRSENAQLRRRLRINNQQMKEKLQHLEKPESTYHTVQLDLLQHKLRQECEEVKSSRDQLKEQLRVLQREVDHLRMERSKLLEILVSKDTERYKAEKKWAEDIARYRHDTEHALEKANRASRDKDITEKQLHIVHISLEQRDKEIARLRDIVRNLQDSMKDLLKKLKSMTPPDQFNDLFKKGNKLLSKEALLLNEDKRCIGMTSNKTPVGSSSSSARRVLPFSTEEAPVLSGQNHKDEEDSNHGDPQAVNVTSSPVQKQNSRDEQTDQLAFESLNNTEYITAPGTSPVKKVFDAKSHHFVNKAGIKHKCSQDSGVPTVKDLLTPLKDRMQIQYKRLSAGSQSKAPEASTSPEAIPILPEEDGPLAVSLDSTLLDESTSSEKEAIREEDVTESRMSHDEVSRYSMTDYFKKYPHVGADTNTAVKQAICDIEECVTSDSSSNKKFSSNNYGDNFDASDSDTDFRDPKHLPHADYAANPSHSSSSETGKSRTCSSNERASFQETMYKGTVLETSISTIDDAASVASSAMTLSSFGTIDDSSFQQGLADLDANIARIQAQLQASLAQYSS